MRVAMFIMIGSGWKIYNDEVMFGWLHFPEWITIGGEAQGALQWHFFGMWILMINGLGYLTYGFATGRFRRMLLPIWPSALIADIRDALRFHLRTTISTQYNAVQSCSISASSWSASCRCLSGLAIWKPVQFSELLRCSTIPDRAAGAFPLHGGDRGFLVVHVTLALLVPQTLSRMITGGPVVDAAGRRAGARSTAAARPNRPLSGDAMSIRTPSPSIFRPKQRIDQSVLDENRRWSRRSTAASCCAAPSASAR